MANREVVPSALHVDPAYKYAYFRSLLDSGDQARVDAGELPEVLEETLAEPVPVIPTPPGEQGVANLVKRIDEGEIFSP